MIIDGSYFTGEIFLPQVGLDASTLANNNAKLQEFIEEYEPEILEMALGHSLYDEFVEQFGNDNVLKAGVDQKWDNLLNGTVYTDNGVQYKWRGLITDKGKRRMSMMAYYIYCKYVEDGITQKSTVGVVKAEAKNAVQADATPTIVNAWRKMHEWYGGGDTQSNYFKGYVKGVFVEDYFLGAKASRKVSLYEFLCKHQEDYPNWDFTPIENKNSWGI